MGYQSPSNNDFKKSVRVASRSNINISSPGASIDGVSLSAGNRVLLAGQTTGSQNGIYYWNGAATAMTRARDGDQAGEITSGMVVSVSEGTDYLNTLWMLITDDPITLDSTSLTFIPIPAYKDEVQVFTASGTISANSGHFVTFSGAASQTLTLPAASVGQWFEILNIDGSDVVTVARAGSDTINGGTSVEVGPGDRAKIICTAAATWVAIFDRFPWKARMSLASSATQATGFQKVGSSATWTNSYDVRPNGASAQVDNTTNRRIDIRRAGLYLVQANVSFTGIGTSTTVTAGYVYTNGTARMVATGYAWTTAGIRTHYISGSGGLSVGDYLELYGYQNESASEAYSYDGLGTTLHDTYLSIQWLGPSGSA